MKKALLFMIEGAFLLHNILVVFRQFARHSIFIFLPTVFPEPDLPPLRCQAICTAAQNGGGAISLTV